MRYLERITEIQEGLGADQALLVEDKINTFYLTGQEMTAGRLLFTRKAVFLFADGRYYQQVASTPGVKAVLWTGDRWREFLKNEIPEIKTLEFASHLTSYARYQELSQEFQGELVPVKNRLERIRCIKDEEEIHLMKEAAALGSLGCEYVYTLLKEGVTEKSLAAELDIFWRRQGAQGCAFSPIIAFGAHSAFPHYHPGDHKLKKGDTVLIDIGVTLNHYHSDMTRVVFYGEPDLKMKEVYELVLKAQETGIALAKPGVTVADLDAAVRKVISDAGYGEYFVHSLGHSIGLEVHEIPSLRSSGEGSDTKLEKGMLVTIEPGIYLPDLGGVRIEDTIVITEEGSENLTKVSKQLKLINKN